MQINFIDLILIIIFAACVAGGYARGLVLSVISLAKYLVGIPLAFFAADELSRPVYDRFISEAALQKISEGITQSADIDSFTASVKEAVSQLPFGIGGSVDLSFLNGVSNESAANAVLVNVVEPIALAAVKIAVFVLALALFLVLVRIIVHFIKKLQSKKHAPLRRTNKFFGAVFGILQGVVALASLCAVIAFLRGSLFSGATQFAAQADSSLVVEFVNKINPLLSII